MSIFAVIWNAIGVDLGWLFLVMGLLIGGAVFPAAFAITWTGQSTAGAIAGPVAGLCAGITAWLVTANSLFGELTIASTGHEYSTLAGNMAAVFTGLIVTVLVSIVKPQNFDWEVTRSINSPPVNALESTPEESSETSLEVKPQTAAKVQGDEKNLSGDETPVPSASLPPPIPKDDEAQADADLEEHPSKLRRALVTAYISACLLTFIMDFLVSHVVPSHHKTLANAAVLGPHPYVPLALYFLKRLLHSVGCHIIHMGFRFDVHQLRATDSGNERLPEAICGASVE